VPVPGTPHTLIDPPFLRAVTGAFLDDEALARR
jgi:hypothetical protein